MLKRCCTCKVEKDLICFGKKANSNDGLMSICKECKHIKDKEYTDKHKAERAATSKEWHSKNRKSTKEYIKRSKEESYEHHLLKQREYYQSNREKVKASIIHWQKDNPNRVKANQKAYAEAHPEKFMNSGKRLFCSFVVKPIIIERDSYCCQMCSSKNDLILHHILPVKYDTDDKNVLNPKNLITLCEKCHLIAHNGHYKNINKTLAMELIQQIREVELAKPTILPEYIEPEKTA